MDEDEEGSEEAESCVNISVVIRVRPLTPSEHNAGQAECWKSDTGSIWQSAPGALARAAVPQQAYAFDRVFATSETTADIHRSVVAPRVARLLHGYSATVIAQLV